MVVNTVVSILDLIDDGEANLISRLVMPRLKRNPCPSVEVKHSSPKLYKVGRQYIQTQRQSSIKIMAILDQSAFSKSRNPKNLCLGTLIAQYPHELDQESQ